jgi:hypothetical protein
MIHLVSIYLVSKVPTTFSDVHETHDRHFYICINVYSLNAMKPKTRRSTRRRRRSRKLTIDPACWGKNKPLEQLWRDLSSYLSAVIIYKGSKPYEIVKLQPPSASHIYSQFRAHDADPQVIAILTAHPHARNAYETLLYPKAKDKTVDHVITNYTRFFKRVPAHMQALFTEQPIKKLMVPH